MEVGNSVEGLRVSQFRPLLEDSVSVSFEGEDGGNGSFVIILRGMKRLEGFCYLFCFLLGEIVKCYAMFSLCSLNMVWIQAWNFP